MSVRMFSFVGDTVLDPFAGTGTTSLAAAKWGRNSIAVEIDSAYAEMILKRMSYNQSFCWHVEVKGGTVEHQLPCW